MKVSIADLPAQFAPLREEMTAAVLAVLESGHFGLTEGVAAFERAVAAVCGAKHGIGLNSGTDALMLSLLALDLEPGDEIVTTPFTFVATAEAIALLGLKPVFADIDPVTYNLDPAKAEAAIPPRTRALLPVHLFGQMADMEALTRIATAHDLPLIGDAAQAIGCSHRGLPVGQWSLLTTLSFFPTKNLGAAGDGGMVLTNDDALAEKLRCLRSHGSSQQYQYKYVGICSRLDAIQAAVLSVKLPHLDVWNEKRRENAAYYDERFADLEGLVTPCRAPENVHTYHQYTVRVLDGQRDALRAYLAAHGVASGIYYPGPLHLEEAYRYLGYEPGDMPEAERAGREVLSLPVVPELTTEQRECVADSVRAFFGKEA